MDAGLIEHRLLELAHTTDAKITAPTLAYFAPCSIDDASRVLDDLAAHDRLSMEIEDDGTVVYQLPGRQKISAPGSGNPGSQGSFGSHGQVDGRPHTALVPIARSPGGPSPMLAAALTALLPGAGHLYAGRIGAAVLWFVVVSMGYVLLVPGLVLHLFAMASAAASARRAEFARARLPLAAISAP